MTNLFITGTDTNVGKTICSALLIHHASKTYDHIKYYKAIQTGIEKDCDASIIKDLIPNRAGLTTQRGLAFKRPLSPHIAAHYANSLIDFKKLLNDTKRILTADVNLIEGAGGLFVPINQRYFMIDFIEALRTPVILVARSGLGTINHTLLSLRALCERDISVRAVITVGPRNRDNEASLKYFSRVKKFAAIPHLSVITRESLALLADKLATNLDLFNEH